MHVAHLPKTYGQDGNHGLWRRLFGRARAVPPRMSMVLGQTLAWRVQREEP